MMRVVAFVCLSISIACLAISGCMLVQPQCKPPALWQKAGATQGQFFADKALCIYQAQFNRETDPVGLNWQSFNACMQAAGYTPID